jgi:hypothetical protein
VICDFNRDLVGIKGCSIASLLLIFYFSSSAITKIFLAQTSLATLQRILQFHLPRSLHPCLPCCTTTTSSLIMSSHQGGYYYPSTSAPITMPTKNQNPYYNPYPYGPYSRISVSPPEVTDGSTTSGGGSYDPTGTSSSYAASASDYDPNSSSSSGAPSIDLLEYMNDRMHTAFNPMPLDRSLAQQTQA